MTRKEKILITGASSRLMQCFASLVDLDRYRLLGLTRRPGTLRQSPFREIAGDIRSFPENDPALKGCVLVVHAAAVTHASDPALYDQVNYHASKNLVDWSARRNIRFVFISSRAAGPRSGAYGLSKLKAEKYIRRHHPAWLIFRPAEIYGGSGVEGIESLIHEVLTKKWIFCPASLPSRIYPIGVDDTARIIHDAVFNRRFGNKMITVNGPKGFTYMELARYIASAAGVEAILLPVPKIVMYLLKFFLTQLPLNCGIVPDQVDRLYSRKKKEFLDFDYSDFGAYIRTKAKMMM
jgi:nucleoside-diphosphate-sugar epimerase